MRLEVLFLGAYVVAVLAIGLTGKLRQTSEEYVVGARKVQTLPLTAAIFATLVTESLIFFAVSLTSRFGPLAGAVVILGPAAGLLLLSAFAGRIHEAGARRQLATAAEYCRESWGGVAGRFARWIMMGMLFWIVILQINLNGRLMAALLGWSTVTATILVVGVVSIYLALGGYFAVIRTDLFQTLVLFVMVLMPVFIRPIPAASGVLTRQVLSSDVPAIFTMSLALTIVRPELWQRTFSAASGEVARRSLRLAALLYVGFGAFVFYYAYALVQASPDLPGADAFAKGYRVILPPVLAAAFPVILLAAMMSSLDSAVFTLAVDLVGKRVERRQLWTRGVVIAALVAAGALSINVYDALAFAYRLDGFIALLCTPLIASFTVTVPRKQMIWSIAVGVVAYALMLASGRLQQHPAEAVLGSVATGVVLAVSLLLRRARGRDTVTSPEPGDP